LKREDTDLVVEQFPELNRQFYSANPTAYFKRRLHLLLVAAGASDQLQQLFADGIRYEGIIAKLEPPADADADNREWQSFLATDAEVLLHHSSEALLRLYFAHRDKPQCPWLECARLRSFATFKSQADTLQNSYQEREHVAAVFLGPTYDENNPDTSQAAEQIERLLKILAGRLLDDSNLYNAAKHGLAVISGESGLTVGDSDGQPLFGSNGQSLAFLEIARDDSDEPKWQSTTRWVSIKQAMWLTMLVVTEMASLWSIAKWRYTGARPEGLEVIKKEALDDALVGTFANGQPITRFSTRLYYRRNEPQSE